MRSNNPVRSFLTIWCLRILMNVRSLLPRPEPTPPSQSARSMARCGSSSSAPIPTTASWKPAARPHGGPSWATRSSS